MAYQWRDMGRITAEDAEAEIAAERLFSDADMARMRARWNTTVEVGDRNDGSNPEHIL